MATPIKLLVVEDVPDDAEFLARELRQGGFDLRWERVDTEAAFLRRLAARPDLIISDYSMPQFSGLRALELLTQEGSDIPFILVSGTTGEEQAVEAMKRGASDYLLKDRIARLSSAVRHALEEKRLRTERQQIRRQLEQAGAALQESETRLAGIINSATDAIISVDSDQRIVLFNPAAEQMFGYSASEMLGHTLDHLIPQRFHRAHAAHVRAFGETGVTTRRMGALGTIFGLRADATEFPIEASISQLEAGGQKLFTVILRDITARKRGEEALNRLAAIVESSADAITGETVEGTVTSWNAGAERIFGYRAPEVTGRPIGMLALPELEAEEQQIRETIARGERLLQFETTRRHQNGTPVNVSLTVSPIRDAAGTIIGASRIAHDITERKRLEAALAAAAEEERGRIARDLHDGLGQQLGGALFLSELLHRDLQQRDAAEGQRAGQIHALIVEALTQARALARGLYPVPPEPDGLMNALRNLADHVARDWRLDCTFDTNSAVLVPDPMIATHCYRIAQEAVNNALKHSGARRIELQLTLTAETLELSVRDFGHGWSAAKLPQGLGLQTMRQRARLMGGRLDVQNLPEGGLRVSCSLPRARAVRPPSQ